MKFWWQNFRTARPSWFGGGAEFARNWICKERNVHGKPPQFASVWTCKEWIYPGNQEMELARNSICKERNLQGMRTMLCLSQFR